MIYTFMILPVGLKRTCDSAFQTCGSFSFRLSLVFCLHKHSFIHSFICWTLTKHPLDVRHCASCWAGMMLGFKSQNCLSELQLSDQSAPLESSWPEFKHYFKHWLVEQIGIRHFTSLSLSFLTWKRGQHT